MRQYNWSTELKSIFQQVEVVSEDVQQHLKEVYVKNGLEWTSQIMKNLSGEIHTKCLGVYLQRILAENGVKTSMSYEEKLSPTKYRSDILINGTINIESKAQGIFSLPKLRERWDKLNANVPNQKHVLVSWCHNAKTITKIREFMPESHHYYFHNRQTKQDQPRELERLISNSLDWLKQ
jgi:hypothetical protein